MAHVAQNDEGDYGEDQAADREEGVDDGVGDKDYGDHVLKHNSEEAVHRIRY